MNIEVYVVGLFLAINNLVLKTIDAASNFLVRHRRNGSFQYLNVYRQEEQTDRLTDSQTIMSGL